MARELAYVLINPYTIAKSRTGGVIARYLARTELDFVAARMFGPSVELATRFANLIRTDGSEDGPTRDLIADYVLTNYVPNTQTGRRRRVMLLLFDGEDAVRKLQDVTGSVRLKSDSGLTVRDTYGDYLLDEQGHVRYFEPAVLVASTPEIAESSLRLWAEYSESDGGLIQAPGEAQLGEAVQRTLVLLKPDNFRFRSLRPGNIIDLLSRSGLRIVAVNKFRMTVRQAEEFYGPVRQSLAEKFAVFGGLTRAADALKREFSFDIPVELLQPVSAELARLHADAQFERIVQFMTGYRPSECSDEEKLVLGKEDCFALVYEGQNAVGAIRGLLGPTDPSKAAPGSVRREFGSDILVNAAHASDSPENAVREMRIIEVQKDTIRSWVERCYGSPSN